MAEIPFTQYLLPNGRQKPVTIERSDEIVEKATRIIDAGCRFECECLSIGGVSLTIFDPDTEIDIAIEVVPNGPEVPDAVDRLVASGEAWLEAGRKVIVG